MAGGGNSMKLFQFNRNYSKLMGICVPQSKQRRCKCIAVKLCIVICAAQFVMATAAFIVYDAKSMSDYSQTIFILFCTIHTVSAYFITISKATDILQFTKMCKTFIAKRELLRRDRVFLLFQM